MDISLLPLVETVETKKVEKKKKGTDDVIKLEDNTRETSCPVVRAYPSFLL
jgi:hypothetical protein